MKTLPEENKILFPAGISSEPRHCGGAVAPEALAAANGRTSQSTTHRSGVRGSFWHGVGRKRVPILQGESPLSAIDEHVCGLHFYSGDINRQVIAQHTAPRQQGCSPVRHYDSDKKHARLVGIEYIISSKLFKELPAEERSFGTATSMRSSQGS